MAADEKRKQAEMDLLLDDGNTQISPTKSQTGGKQGKTARDSRFVVDGDNEFAVDPTHKEYRKVVQGHNKVAKRARRH